MRELWPDCLNPRGQAGVADQLAGGREAGDVTDLGSDREAEQFGDAGDRHQQPCAVVGARERP
jgi:hypothetical protein